MAETEAVELVDAEMERVMENDSLLVVVNDCDIVTVGFHVILLVSALVFVNEWLGDAVLVKLYDVVKVGEEVFVALKEKLLVPLCE